MSKDINSLRNKRWLAMDQLEALHTAAADRDFTADEQAQYDALKAEVAGLDGQIARAEELERLRSASARPVTGAQGNGQENPGYKSFGEQLVAVMRAARPDADGTDRTRLMAAASGMSEAVASDGGFLVQRDFSNDLLKRTYEYGQISSRVFRVPISAGSNGLKINAVDETSRANGSRFGGVQAYWKDEAALLAESKPKFRTMELSLKKLTGLCYATDELLQDAAALETIMNQAFAEEFSFKIEDAIINGTGAGQPLGFLNSGAVVSQAIESTQTIANSSGFLANNVTKMWSRMPARNRSSAVWLINQELEPYLTLMTVGGSGGATPVYIPAGGLSGAQYATLLGRPVIPVEYCAALGTPGDIILADLSQYMMIDKGGINGASSIHVRFLYDETTFRFTYRVDGQPVWNSPLTPYKGSATQSPFVTLAVRS